MTGNILVFPNGVGPGKLYSIYIQLKAMGYSEEEIEQLFSEAITSKKEFIEKMTREYKIKKDVIIWDDAPYWLISSEKRGPSK